MTGQDTVTEYGIPTIDDSINSYESLEVKRFLPVFSGKFQTYVSWRKAAYKNSMSLYGIL